MINKMSWTKIIKSSYFTKDIYDRKREYAYNVSSSGIEKIAIAILKKHGITENDDNFDEKLENIVEELQPIADLSHARHDMHSTRDSVSDYEALDMIGNEFSTGNTLLEQVNKLNEKYKIINEELPDEMTVTYLSDEDDSTDIINEAILLGICDKEDTEDIDRDDVIQLLYSIYSYYKNKASNIIRDWFHKINKKYETNFPD